MTAQEAALRNERAQRLRVFQVGEGCFYVDSSEGKIAYKVRYTQDEIYCACGDYAKGIKSDANFKCKHILAVEQCLQNQETEGVKHLEKRKPKLDDRFIKNVDGKDFVLYAGLLDLAHQKGLLKCEADPVQYPSKENEYMAICKAYVVSKSGESFMDVGDASPQNCNSKVAKHLLRMASTRAKARALRDFTNIGMTCLEELGDLDDVIGEEKAQTKKNGKKDAKPKPANPPHPPQQQPEPKPEETKTPGSVDPEPPAHPPEQKKSPEQGKANNNGNGNGNGDAKPKMSEAQRRAVYNLSRRRGISVEELEKMAMAAYGVTLEHLTSADASSFIRTLQQSA